jgi:hypothetical protein
VGFIFRNEMSKSMNSNYQLKNIINDDLIKEIIKAVDSLQYGYVQIVIHNNKIVQIDRTEKTRLEGISIYEEGGGI